MEPTPPPPQNTGYYRPPTNSPMTPFRPPGIYFDSISMAFSILQKDWALWVATTLTYICASIPLALVSALVQNHGDFLYGTPDMNSLLQGQLVSFLNTSIVMTIFAGMIHMGVKAGRGEQIVYRDLFVAVPKIWTVALVTILFYLCVGLGFVALIVPGIFLVGAFALSLPIVVEQNVGAVEAMKRSFEALRPHAWAMFGLLFVSFLASGLGYFACCIGILFSMPLVPIVMGMHYNYFFPSTQAPQPAAYQFLEPPR